MEQTPRWVHGNPTQISEGLYETRLPSEHDLQAQPTSNRGWSYKKGPNTDMGYPELSLNHGVSIPVDPSSYQQPIRDNRRPSPVYSHPEASFNQGTSILQGGWTPNSPLSPVGPHCEAACTLSSASSVQTSPIILSPSIGDHWAYSSFPMNHTYGSVSMSQPNSPVVSVEFDASDPGREMSETYFVSDAALALGQDPNATALPPSTIQLDIETKPTRHRRPSEKSTAPDVRRTTRSAGKGQLPSPSTKTKAISRTRDSETASLASSGSLSLQQQPWPNGPSLRTATRRLKRTPDETPPKPGESVEDQRARENHNQVEKEYRNRLHKGFEELLEALHALPAEELMAERTQSEAVGGVNGEFNDDGEHITTMGAQLDARWGIGLPGRIGTGGKGKKKQRRMSKAEVLHYTCRVLKTMGDDNQELKEEVERLKMLHDKRVKDCRR